MLAPDYRAILRILMPQWGSSYEEVDRFISQVQTKTSNTRWFERYAEIYSMYSRLEGDVLDLFATTLAIWSEMKSGYVGFLKRSPNRDALLTNFANFACRAGAKDTYGMLRASLEQRISSMSWTDKYSIKACDEKFAIGGIKRAATGQASLDPEAITSEHFRALAGIRLGM